MAGGRAHPANTSLGTRCRGVDIMTVLGPNSEEVGVLDKKTATVLIPLKKMSETIRFNLCLGHEGNLMRHNCKEKWPNNTLPLEITIYGPVQNLKEVGDILSDAGLFLQQPTFVDNNSIYRNPHFLSWDEETTTPLIARPGEASNIGFADSIEELMECSNATLQPQPFLQNWRVVTPLKRLVLMMILKAVPDLTQWLLDTR